MNHFVGVGRLVRDAEGREFANGAVTNLTIAFNHSSRKDPNTGKWTNKTAFLKACAWNRGEHGRNADKLRGLQKGQEILVEGRLFTNDYEKNGQKVSWIELDIDSFKLISGDKQTVNTGGSEQLSGKSENSSADEIPW